MTSDHGSAAVIALDPEAVYRVSPEVVVATFDGQILVYHLNRDRALTLNQTAGIILELIAGECSTAEIRELLQRAYPESAEEIGRDVDRTLRYLLRHGALDPPAA